MAGTRQTTWVALAQEGERYRPLAFLIPLVATYHVLIGLVYMLQAEHRFSGSYDLVLQIAPKEAWGATFVVVGAVILVSSRARPYEVARIALYSAALLDVIWAVSLLRDVVEASGDWAFVVIWLCASAVCQILAYLLPHRRHRKRG